MNVVTFLQGEHGLTVFSICLLAAVVAVTMLVVQHARNKQSSDQFDKAHAQAKSELDIALEENRHLISEKTEAQTRYSEVLKTLERLNLALNEANAEREIALREKNQALTDAAVRLKEVQSMQERLVDWETAKKQSVDAAKAATSEIAAQVSTKLLEDHKQETKAAKEEAEKRVLETTEKVTNKFTQVVNTLAALDKDVSENRHTMETVWRALSSPGGAGQFAEIGLENALKSFGLEKGRDFVVQQQIEGKRLRPDVMVFLPGDCVLVIDSKASKFLLELAEAEDQDTETNALSNLSKTMNNHLKDLADRNYAAAVRESYQPAGRDAKIRRINTIMHLPNDAALEKLSIADPKFLGKAAKLGITVASPAALAGLIGFARVEIDFQKQAENQEKIILTTRQLIDSIGVMLEETNKVGKGLKSAIDHFDKVAGSVNSRLLPRIRTLIRYGIRPDRHKGVPAHIPRYQITKLDVGDVIDGEAEEISDTLRLETEEGAVEE